MAETKLFPIVVAPSLGTQSAVAPLATAWLAAAPARATIIILFVFFAVLAAVATAGSAQIWRLFFPYSLVSPLTVTESGSVLGGYSHTDAYIVVQ